jgi:hypothetical protein
MTRSRADEGAELPVALAPATSGTSGFPAASAAPGRRRERVPDDALPAH